MAEHLITTHFFIIIIEHELVFNILLDTTRSTHRPIKNRVNHDNKRYHA